MYSTPLYNRYKKRDFEIPHYFQSRDFHLTPALSHLFQHLSTPHLPQPPWISVHSVRYQPQICPLRSSTSKPAQPRSVLCSAQHSFSRLGQGETAERQLLPSVLFGTWPMSDHAARYRRRHTFVGPDLDLDGKKTESHSSVILPSPVFTANGLAKCEKHWGWLSSTERCYLFFFEVGLGTNGRLRNSPKTSTLVIIPHILNQLVFPVYLTATEFPFQT